MAEKSSLDRSLWTPIAIGVGSLLGICLVLLGLRLSAPRVDLAAAPTQTPVKYQFLATEPGVVLPTQANTPTAEPATETPTAEPLLPLPTEVTQAAITQPAQATRVVATVTASNNATALPIGLTYDDADIRLIYTGNWIGQSGVRDVFQNTLHISSTIGDFVQVVFFGQKVRVVYQAGPSLGQIAINVDGLDFAVDQNAASTTQGIWESPVLALGNHELFVTHISGGAINIDAVIVVDLATPTTTITPTTTATP